MSDKPPLSNPSGGSKRRNRKKNKGGGQEQARQQQVHQQQAQQQQAKDQQAKQQQAKQQQAKQQQAQAIGSQLVMDLKPAAKVESPPLSTDLRHPLDTKGPEQRESEQRGLENRAAKQRGAECRGAEQRGAEQKVSEHRVAEHKGAEHRGAEQKGTEQKGAEHRVAEHKGAEQKGAEQKVSEHRVAEHKGAEHGGAEQRGTKQREAEQRGAEHRGAEQKVAEQKGAEQRGTEQRGTEQREAEQREAEQRRSEERGAEQRCGEQRGSEHRGTEQKGSESRGAEQRDSQQKNLEQKGFDVNDGVPQKSKAQLRAERRAKQEAQRAAKAAAAAAGGGGGKGKHKEQMHKKPASQGSTSSKDAPRVPDIMQVDDEKSRKRMSKKLEKQKVPERLNVHRRVGLFGHLPQYERDVSLTQNIKFATACSIHPAILKLGLQYAEGIICGSNARCIALLAAMKQVIADYSTPPQKELSRDLDSKIKPYISFLNQCRPLSVSMGNAIKYIKWNISQKPRDMSDHKAKIELVESIDNFYKEKIELAGKAISVSAMDKISDAEGKGDVILVYGHSSLISKVLFDAKDKQKKFRVIVVDGRPKLEGREMLRKLVRHGIKCSYVLINTASYVMSEVTKVFLGAHALLANGCVMSRVGNSQVALIAKAYNVPVLICCETYKFCERVQTDSFVFNELGDPGDLVNAGNDCLISWKENTSLSILNLMYDVTPPELVSLVITELGMVPCTSVPVVLRVKHPETPDLPQHTGVSGIASQCHNLV